MSEEKKKVWKKQTKWLDALVYIILPILALILGIRTLRVLVTGSIGGINILFFIIEIVLLALFVATTYYAYHRTKEGYVLLHVLIIISGIQAGVMFAIEQSFDRDPNFLFTFVAYMLACCILWYLPNRSYFKARKELFTNDGNCKFLRTLYKD